MMLRPLALLVPVVLSLVACAAPQGEGEDARRSTFAFTPDEVTAFREPTNAPCGVNDTPYETVDTFDLRSTDKDANAKLAVLALRFGHTSPRSTELIVSSSGTSASDADGILLQVGVRAGAAEKRLASAKLVVGDLPAKDGDALSARVIIEFADGDVLAETISAPVKSAFGACPTGG